MPRFDARCPHKPESSAIVRPAPRGIGQRFTNAYATTPFRPGAMHAGARLMVIVRALPEQMTTADRAVARSDLNLLVGVGGRERTQPVHAERPMPEAT